MCAYNGLILRPIIEKNTQGLRWVLLNPRIYYIGVENYFIRGFNVKFANKIE